MNKPILFIIMFFRQAFTNVKDMLKPGGQLFFIAFEKLFADEAYDELDQGKWLKYENRKAISPFFNSENPLKEYETVIKDLGFVDCHMFIEPFKDRLPEKAFEGMFNIKYFSKTFQQEGFNSMPYVVN